MWLFRSPGLQRTLPYYQSKKRGPSGGPNSANGTYLNDQKIPSPGQAGDKIRLGLRICPFFYIPPEKGRYSPKTMVKERGREKIEEKICEPPPSHTNLQAVASFPAPRFPPRASAYYISGDPECSQLDDLLPNPRAGAPYQGLQHRRISSPPGQQTAGLYYPMSQDTKDPRRSARKSAPMAGCSYHSR